MAGTRKTVLKHVMSGICTKMNRTKQLPNDIMETALNRCLNTFDITLLGIGHMVGVGIYVLTGTVSHDMAGPGIILSFILAAIVSMLAALCYAEFGTRIPKAGSAYIYTYLSIGEFWAFIIGWNIILEHMLGAASVARAWSGYVDSIIGGHIKNITISTIGEWQPDFLSKYPDVLAFLVCISYTCALATGVKTTAIINSILTLINISVILVVIVVGFWYADINNWSMNDGGFLPYGFGGVLAGAATCFYAFVGFDSIATASEEARNPTVSIPLATILSLCVVTIAYVLVSAALTLMVPYTEINPVAALPEAFDTLNITWLKYGLSIGALCGMTTTLLGSLYALPRCLYAMSSDGLLFSFFANVNKTTKIPLINLIISGLLSAILALLFDLHKLVEFMSIGTLLAYTIVSASIIILRYQPPPIEETVIYAPDTPDGSGSGIGIASGAGVIYDDTTSHSSIDSTSSPTADMIQAALAGRLKPEFRFLEPYFGNCEPGSVPSYAVFVFTIFSIGLTSFLHNSNEIYISIWQQFICGILFIIIIACVIVMAAHYQNTRNLQFKVPLVPFIPVLSIFFNIALMVHLSIATWKRFITWITIGMLIYFLYGIHHSKEGPMNTSYSMLMTSSEARKTYWGATAKLTVSKLMKTERSNSNTAADDKIPIIDNENNDIDVRVDAIGNNEQS